MMNRSRLSLAVLLLALLAQAAYPQKKLLCPKPPPSPYKHDAQISTSLDRKVNAMRVTLQHPRTLGKGTELFYMGATFLIQDPRRPSNPTLDLVLVAASPLTKVNAGGLSIICDGRPCAQTRKVNFMTGPGGAEAAKLTLSYAEASSITHARKVVARVGANELEFSNNHLEALREMVSQLAPSPGLWATAGVSAR